MRIIVTGHRGYLGSFLMAELAARGHDASGFDVGFYEQCRYPDGPEPAPASDQEQKDIRDLSPTDVQGADAVVHLAGLSNDPLGSFDPTVTDSLNRAAAVHVAQVARAGGVQRFVFASTCSVYGGRSDGVLDEDADPHPLTPYALAKARAEEEILALMTSDFAPVFMRSGTVFGLGPRPRFDLVLNNLVAWAAATGQVRLKSDGSAWRPLVHARDVARAFAGVLEAPTGAVAGRAFNVAKDATTVTIKDLSERIERRMPGVSITHADDAGPDQRNYRVSGQRLDRLLGPGWAKYDLDGGIDEVATALRRTPVPVAAFEGPTFQRLACIQMALREGRLTPDMRAIVPARQTP